MRLKLAHYRNRFSMFRTYYALREGLLRADGVDLAIIEVPDPPSRELEDALIRGDVDLANLYLPNFFERRLAGAPIVGLCTEWKLQKRDGARGPDVWGSARAPYVLQVNLSVPAKTVPEFIARPIRANSTWPRPASERRTTSLANCSR